MANYLTLAVLSGGGGGGATFSQEVISYMVVVSRTAGHMGSLMLMREVIND